MSRGCNPKHSYEFVYNNYNNANWAQPARVDDWSCDASRAFGAKQEHGSGLLFPEVSSSAVVSTRRFVCGPF